MFNNVIEVKNVCKTYKSGLLHPHLIKAVDGINFDIKKGEIFGLLGPNGAGKTTTVKMIAGLIKPTSGEILVNGQTSVRSKTYMDLIGSVLEGNRNIFWNMSPIENLYYFGRLRDVKETYIKSRAYELISEFDLIEKKDESVGKLSRGMQQKVALCCALISDPPVLLVDEPTLGLDVQSTKKIKSMLLNMAHEREKSILLTTHDMRLASEISDRIGIINKGKLIKIGTFEELKQLFSSSEYKITIPVQDKTFKEELSNLIPEDAFSDNENGELSIVMNFNVFYDKFSSVVDIMKRYHVIFQSIEKKEYNLEEIFLKLIEEGENEISKNALR